MTRRGGQWWEAQVWDSQLTLPFRVRGGDLIPLQGAPRRIPEHLQVHVDFATKMGAFRVGLRRLEGELALTRNPGERGFRARFRRIPEWELPFLLKPFLRASLRRPFHHHARSQADEAEEKIQARCPATQGKQPSHVPGHDGRGAVR